MKNLFKFGFLALALSLSVVACSEKKAESTDTMMTDSSMMTTTTDTTVQDSTVKDTVATTTTTETKKVN